jgi:urea transporter
MVWRELRIHIDMNVWRLITESVMRRGARGLAFTFPFISILALPFVLVCHLVLMNKKLQLQINTYKHEQSRLKQ